MSYTERYSREIPVSIPYKYPASQHGGSDVASTIVPVHIEVYVDTDEYDNQIGVTSGKLVQLSNTIDQTTHAELVSIRQNSENISSTIVSGFFSYIRSDLSQQISEFRPKVDSKFIEMVKQKEAVLSKMDQMTEDFHRIASRYTKLFSELDRETRTRIHALDASSFRMQELLTESIYLPLRSKLLPTATVTSQEETSIRTKLHTSRLRSGTRLLIDRAREVISSYNRLGLRLRAILSNESTETSTLKYLPVLFSESVWGRDEILLESHCSPEFAPFKSEQFRDRIEQIYSSNKPKSKTIDSKTHQQLSEFLKKEIDSLAVENSEHTIRVKNLMWSLWEKNNDLQLNRD